MEVPAAVTSRLANSQVLIKFTDVHVGCPGVFFENGYTAKLMKIIYPFTAQERKQGVDKFEVWYKTLVPPPQEAKWELLANDEMLPPDAVITDWWMVDPTNINKKINKVKLVK